MLNFRLLQYLVRRLLILQRSIREIFSVENLEIWPAVNVAIISLSVIEFSECFIITAASVWNQSRETIRLEQTNRYKITV